MKIYFAAIENSDAVQKIALNMADALGKGQLHAVYVHSEKLKSKADKQHCRMLTDVEWEDLLKVIRTYFPTFSSDYVISPGMVHKLLDVVHDFPAGIGDILCYAESAQLGILQLPVDED